ncbi:MAG: DNA (cytosine-5-)-methyltransferase [Flavobacteriales bacterium]|nr:DNA (cytosine-5-)-methyltransferase [Flavobacteriales bacterium]
MSKEINYIDLFSGLGAFAKGLLDAGFQFKNHYFSEVDKFAIANYRYNFKTANYVGKIQEIEPEKIQRPDILTFGSPCQDISNAGLKKGLFGRRSKLFFDAIGIIDRLRPKIFVFENVKGLLFSNKGKDFEIVLREIANLGLYECQWQLINTAWFLPQNRERLFLVGSLAEISAPKVFPLLKGYNENQTKEPLIKVVDRYSTYRQDIIYSPKGYAPTLIVGKGTPTSYIKVGRKIRKLTPIEQERLQGLPDDWTKFGVFEDGIQEISMTQRQTMLGNAITSTVMKLIGERLLSVFTPKISNEEEKRKQLYNELNGLK